MTEVGTHEGIKGSTEEMAKKKRHGQCDATASRGFGGGAPIRNKIEPKSMDTIGKEIPEFWNLES